MATCKILLHVVCEIELCTKQLILVLDRVFRVELPGQTTSTDFLHATGLGEGAVMALVLDFIVVTWLVARKLGRAPWRPRPPWLNKLRLCYCSGGGTPPVSDICRGLVQISHNIVHLFCRLRYEKLHGV